MLLSAPTLQKRAARLLDLVTYIHHPSHLFFACQTCKVAVPLAAISSHLSKLKIHNLRQRDVQLLLDAWKQLYLSTQPVALTVVEVSEIGIESVSALIDIAKSQDKDLAAAISAAMRAAVSTPNLKEAIFVIDFLKGRQTRHHIQQLQQQDCELGSTHGHSWRPDHPSLVLIQHLCLKS
jgi:hypothetical protein